MELISVATLNNDLGLKPMGDRYYSLTNDINSFIQRFKMNISTLTSIFLQASTQFGSMGTMAYRFEIPVTFGTI